LNWYNVEGGVGAENNLISNRIISKLNPCPDKQERMRSEPDITL